MWRREIKKMRQRERGEDHQARENGSGNGAQSYVSRLMLRVKVSAFVRSPLASEVRSELSVLAAASIQAFTNAARLFETAPLIGDEVDLSIFYTTTSASATEQISNHRHLEIGLLNLASATSWTCVISATNSVWNKPISLNSAQFQRIFLSIGSSNELVIVATSGSQRGYLVTGSGSGPFSAAASGTFWSEAHLYLLPATPTRSQSPSPTRSVSRSAVSARFPVFAPSAVFTAPRVFRSFEFYSLGFFRVWSCCAMNLSHQRRFDDSTMNETATRRSRSSKENEKREPRHMRFDDAIAMVPFQFPTSHSDRAKTKET
jgi:hypothetical protein